MEVFGWFERVCSTVERWGVAFLYLRSSLYFDNRFQEGKSYRIVEEEG